MMLFFYNNDSFDLGTCTYRLFYHFRQTLAEFVGFFLDLMGTKHSNMRNPTDGCKSLRMAWDKSAGMEYSTTEVRTQRLSYP